MIFEKNTVNIITDFNFIKHEIMEVILSVFGDSVKKPCHMDPPPSAAEAVIEMMGGFFLTVTCKGIIVIVTSNIETHLGYSQVWNIH
jgi:hypothetical protein